MYKVNGFYEAITEAEKLKMGDNHFYFLLLGELYKNADKAKVKMNFQKAFSFAKTITEKDDIQKKIDSLD